MSNKEKQKLALSGVEGIVPELRFPEFENDWEKVKLKDVSTYFNGKSFEGDVQEEGKYELITLKSIDASGNLVHSKRYINDEVSTLTRGALVMILSEQAPGLLGMTAIIPLDNKFVLNQRVAEIRPNDKVESFFLSMAINRNQRIFSRLGAGMKVQNISKSNVENYEFYYPTLAEQQKIANCLSSLDHLITAETEKLDQLKDHKKGLLQHLFPAKSGSLSGAEVRNIPQLRFPQFVGDGDWVEKLISDLANRYDNLRIPVTASNRIEGTTPYYGANGIQSYVKGCTHDGEFILVAEDGANDLQNYPVQYANGKIWVNNHAHVLQGKKEISDNIFLMYAIQNTNMEPYLVGGGRAKLNANVMMKIGFLVPPSLKEQQKIANCLSSADALIEAQTTKIKTLKEHKKGLMQQLFPNV